VLARTIFVNRTSIPIEETLATGLTTGPITHILDRLEKQQFVERLRDAQDRRKVLVRVRPESLQPLIPKYEAMGKEYLRLAEQYSDKELALICDYMQKTSEISERELAKAIAANRSRTPAAAPLPSRRARKSPR
jgi:DNA-binding MarR family transcriptional regulator